MNKTIKDISLEIGSGITPLRSNELYWNSSDIPWIKTEQLGQYRIFDSMEYISDFALEDTNIRLWSPHTVSVAMYGEGKTRGNVSILMIETTTNQACCNIKVNDALADYRFLYYWLKNNYENLRALSAGVRKNLNADDIKNFSFPENSLSEQEKIADILSVVDDKIELNSKICSELEAMSKTLYDYWFVQFDFPDENGKPYRTSGGEMVWNEQLKREIPDGWNLGSVNNLLKIENTSVIPNKYGNAVMEHYSIPVFDDDHNPVYEEASTIESGKYAVDPECILISKLNPQFKRLWDPYCDTANAICSTEFIVYRPRVAWTRPFCYAVLNSDAFYSHMTGKATCSTGSRKRIQPDVSASFELPIPDKKTMHSFTELYAPIMEKRKSLYKENRELTRLRDWLLPMLMNGQVTVVDAKEEVSKAILYAPQTVEVRQAARTFGDKETDDTADLVQAYLRRKRHDSKT